MKSPTGLKLLVKPRVIAMLDGILALLVYSAGGQLLSLFGLDSKDSTTTIIVWLLILLIIVCSWLIYFLYKFHVIEKELLNIQPDFYSQKEFNKWFDYYANKKDKNP
jgi:hypothetical protein